MQLDPFDAVYAAEHGFVRHGIETQSCCDYWCHVCPGNSLLYMYRRATMVEYLLENQERLPELYKSTGYGKLISPPAFVRVQPIHKSVIALHHYPAVDAGRWAERVFIESAKLSKAGHWVVGEVVRLEQQCSHGDVLLMSDVSSDYWEVKLDTGVCNSGRLFIQVMECRNPSVDLLTQEYYILKSRVESIKERGQNNE